MDFFSTRFNKRLSSLGFHTKPNPQQLLTKFKNIWETVLYESKSEEAWKRPIDKTSIPGCLKSLIDIFVKEQALSSDSKETGACIELFLNDEILDHLVTLSANDLPPGYRGEVIKFTSNLIGLIDMRFLFSHCIHRPIVKLINHCIKSKDIKFHEAMLELEVNLCTKIDSSPELLPLFFDVSQSGTVEPETKRAFGMLEHIMKFVHSDGANGDRARTVCPILFALAQNGDDLETFILEKNFVIQIIAGLSGLYAQLPPVMPDADGSLDSEHSPAARRLFITDVRAFVDYVGFVQALLERCPSKRVTQDIIEKTRSIFFKTVLSASVNGVSDFDGTALTMLFYIQQLADTITDPRLSAIFVQFLLKSDDDEDDTASQAGGSRSGEMRLAVRDILISKLNSLSEHVVTATLQLFYTLMRDHTHATFPMLFEKLPNGQLSFDTLGLDNDIDVQRHLQLVARYFALLPRGNADSGLDSYIRDAELNFAAVKSRASSIDIDGISMTRASSSDSMPGVVPGNGSPNASQSGAVPSSRANQSKETFREQAIRLRSDPTLHKLMSKFRNLFSHSMLINIAMTGVLQQLVIAPYPVLYACVIDGDETLEDAETRAPSFYHVIIHLLEEIDERRASMPDFDARLTSCKQALLHKGSGAQNDEWARHEERLRARPAMNMDEFDMDAEFLRNVVVLEEFIKELLAAIVTRGSVEYDHMAYL